MQFVVSLYHPDDSVPRDFGKTMSPALRKAIIQQVNLVSISLSRRLKSDVFLQLRKTFAAFLGLGRGIDGKTGRPKDYDPNFGLFYRTLDFRRFLDPESLRMKMAIDKKHEIEKVRQQELQKIDDEVLRAPDAMNGIEYYVDVVRSFKQRYAATFKNHATHRAFDPTATDYGIMLLKVYVTQRDMAWIDDFINEDYEPPIDVDDPHDMTLEVHLVDDGERWPRWPYSYGDDDSSTMDKLRTRLGYFELEEFASSDPADFVVSPDRKGQYPASEWQQWEEWGEHLLWFGPKIAQLWALAKEYGLKMKSVKRSGRDELRGDNQFLMDDQLSGFAELFEVWYEPPRAAPGGGEDV